MLAFEFLPTVYQIFLRTPERAAEVLRTINYFWRGHLLFKRSFV